MKPPPIPAAAIAYLTAKGIRPGFHYMDVWLGEHSRNFTIAKMMDIDLLTDVRESIAKAKKDGITYRDWSKSITKLMQEKGWWGKQKMRDPQTGETVTAQLGSPRRLKTIFDVNTRQAYQAGVWERGSRSQGHPYILYRIGASREHRPEHLAWDGLVLPKDHPFWQTHNPQNGYGCKCSTRFVSAAKLRRLERDGIADMTSLKNGRPIRRIPIKTQHPKLETTTYVNKRTGKTHQGYKGIDPGFEHNPGVSDSTERLYREKLKAFEEEK